MVEEDGHVGANMSNRPLTEKKKTWTKIKHVEAQPNILDSLSTHTNSCCSTDRCTGATDGFNFLHYWYGFDSWEWRPHGA